MRYVVFFFTGTQKGQCIEITTRKLQASGPWIACSTIRADKESWQGRVWCSAPSGKSLTASVRKRGQWIDCINRACQIQCKKRIYTFRFLWLSHMMQYRCGNCSLEYLWGYYEGTLQLLWQELLCMQCRGGSRICKKGGPVGWYNPKIAQK